MAKNVIYDSILGELREEDISQAGAGDMTKAVYDADGDGIVDHAATADAVGDTTAAQVSDAVGKAHTHANKATLDKLAEADGKLTYDGAEIGGTVDESRLLPALDSVPVDRSGNPVVFKAVSEGMDERTVLYCPFDVDWNDHSANGARFFEVGFSESSSSCMSISLEQKKFGAGSLLSTDGGPKHTLQGQLATPVGGSDFTMHFWIYVNAHEGNPILSTMSRLVTSADNAGGVLEGVYAGGLCFITYDNQLWFDLTSGNDHSEFLRMTVGTNIQGGWHHIALVRQGNNWYFFLDGVLGATKVKADVQGMPCLNLGGWKTSHGKAYLDELIILDYAKWITDFEPPTQPATTLTKSYTVSDKSGGTVQSVNGQLPDESGNVTVETGGGGFGEWLNFLPEATVMIIHDFNDADAPGVIQLRDGDGLYYDLPARIVRAANTITLNYAGLQLSGVHSIRFAGSAPGMLNPLYPDNPVALYEDYAGGDWEDSVGNHKLVKNGTVTANNGAAVFANDGILSPESQWGLSETFSASFVINVNVSGSTVWFNGENGGIGVYEQKILTGRHSVNLPTSAAVAGGLNRKLHMLIVRNASQMSYYLDGVKLENSGEDYWGLDDTYGLGKVHSEHQFNGTIWHCALYNRALTDDDAAQLWTYVKNKFSL